MKIQHFLYLKSTYRKTSKFDFVGDCGQPGTRMYFWLSFVSGEEREKWRIKTFV